MVETAKQNLALKHFININKLGKDEQECFDQDCCRKTFWGRDIEVSKKFYLELREHKAVMLIPEIHKDDGLILNLPLYFDRTIEFTVINEEQSYDSITLFCELNSYFIPNPSDNPF